MKRSTSGLLVGLTLLLLLLPLPATLITARDNAWPSVAFLAELGVEDGHASCNVIPRVETAYPSTLGSITSPIAAPSRPVEIRLTPCDASPGFTTPASMNTVKLTFEPPNGPGTTLEFAASTQSICAKDTLKAGQTCSNDDDCCVGCTGSCLPPLDECSNDVCRVLRFAMPSKEALSVSSPPSDLTLTGPATIKVSNARGTVATIGKLFVTTSGCNVQPETVFHTFTVLPVPNDFEEQADTPQRLLMTVDGDGNLLVPFTYAAVLAVDTADTAVARLVQGSGLFPAFSSNPDVSIAQAAAAREERSAYVSSFTLDGRLLPPLLKVNSLGEIYGTVDSNTGIIRISRSVLRCSITNATLCTVDADCPDGETCELSPPMFDVTDRLFDARGPIVVSESAAALSSRSAVRRIASAASELTGPGFELDVREEVPLQGLRSSSQIAAFSDVSGNIRLLSAQTGDTTDTGQRVTHLSVTGSSRVAVEADSGLVAYLQSEARQQTDVNDNGSMAENILRVFPSDGTERTAGQSVVGDPELVVNKRSLTISGPLVFFRRSEAEAAQQHTVLVSKSTAGVKGNGWSANPVISGDGRAVAFQSAADNLVPSDRNRSDDVFVHDRVDADTNRVTVAVTAPRLPGGSYEPRISADGRFIAFSSDSGHLVKHDNNKSTDCFVRDTCVSRGLPVAGCEPATERVSVALDGAGPQARANGDSYDCNVSADGRFVSFVSRATNLVRADKNGRADVFLRDRAAGITERVDVAPYGAEADTPSEGTLSVVSGDGRFVAFDSTATNLVSGDTNSVSDVFVRDRCFAYGRAVPGCRARTHRVSVGANGGQSNQASFFRDLSLDGRFVLFASDGDNLVSDDTNGVTDLFVRDVVAGVTERVSVATEGTQGDQGSSGWRSGRISADGRFVTFASDAATLVADDTNQATDVFVRDRLTEVTYRASVASDGAAEADAPSHAADMSAVARAVTFASDAGNLVNGDRADTDVFVRGPDLDDLSYDLNHDGDILDTVLEAFDTATSTLRPNARVAASFVAVADQRAVVLTKESDQGAKDLNHDGDTADTVAQVYDGRTDTLTSLARAATHAAISAHLVGLAVPEVEEQLVLNADGDRDDDVLAVQDLPLRASPKPRNLGVSTGFLAATDLCSGGSRTGEECTESVECPGGRCSGILAFLTPEASEAPTGLACGPTNRRGKCDLNGDGDANDVVLRLYRQADGLIMNTGQAAQDVVVNGHLVAFRTPEAAQGHSDLNGDGDSVDLVMQVFDLATGTLVNTGQAARPCTFPACTFYPYKVAGDTVSFVTAEADQGRDLNGNGSTTDVVMQIFSLAALKLQVVDLPSGAPLLDPFLGDFLGNSVLWVSVTESWLQRDVNGDGLVDDSPVVVVSGDRNGDGLLDDVALRRPPGIPSTTTTLPVTTTTLPKTTTTTLPKTTTTTISGSTTTVPDVTTTTIASTTTTLPPTTACGDPLDPGSFTANDALFILRAALGLRTCELCVCDVDDDGRIVVSDALLVLRRVVDESIVLRCPACEP